MQQDNPQAQAPVAARIVTCVECGRQVPADEVIQFGEYSVCADCKPVFQQKLAEGSFRPMTLAFASVGRRFAAVSLDGVLIWFVFFIVGISVFAALGKSGLAASMVTLSTIAWPVFSTVMSAGYMIFFTGKYGATPGKMALGIKVVRATGAPMGYGLATGRYFATFVSSMTLGIGYLIAFFDEEKRTLHDRICATRVIRT